MFYKYQNYFFKTSSSYSLSSAVSKFSIPYLLISLSLRSTTSSFDKFGGTNTLGFFGFQALLLSRALKYFFQAFYAFILCGVIFKIFFLSLKGL